MADETKKEIDAKVKSMTEQQMLERRSELVLLSRNIIDRPEGLTIDEYTELVSIYARLRGEKGGPASDATLAKRAAKTVNIADMSDLP